MTGTERREGKGRMGEGVNIATRRDGGDKRNNANGRANERINHRATATKGETTRRRATLSQRAATHNQSASGRQKYQYKRGTATYWCILQTRPTNQTQKNQTKQTKQINYRKEQDWQRYTIVKKQPLRMGKETDRYTMPQHTTAQAIDKDTTVGQ